MKKSVPLLSVLLVDDEPFIRKGLANLIDWEAEGYYIAGEASNGYTAIELLKNNQYDLIISDIKMPEMDGIELITYIKRNKISTAKVILLSGFYDFDYAKTAIQCACYDYILKPIKKEELLEVIRAIMEEHQEEEGDEQKKRIYEKAYLDNHLMAIMTGGYDQGNINCVKEHLLVSEEVAYIHCEIFLNDEKFHVLSEDNKREQQKRLYNYANLLLKDYKNHIVHDVINRKKCYNIGIIYCCAMAKEKKLSQKDWIEWLVKELTERVGFKIVATMGSEVSDISLISNSYREAIMIRSFRFHKKYDNGLLMKKNEAEKINSKRDDYKKQLNELIHFIEINDRFKVKENADIVYKNMMKKDIGSEEVEKGIQYLLYRLLGLGYSQDANIDQEEIMQYINEVVFASKINNEGQIKFHQFALNYADYIAQLRQNSATGSAVDIIKLIEEEIEVTYAENISLKLLGEKYFINSAYLGQVFKKQCGCSFKDYLNGVRMRKAAELMINTDKLICEISFDVGYKNQEYFISKFVDIYNVTPARFRKRNKKTS